MSELSSFICSFRTKKKCKSHKKACKKILFCNSWTSNEENKISEFAQYLKSIKVSCIIYTDRYWAESLLEQMDAKINQKICLQKKPANILCVVIQYLQDMHLITKK